MGSERDSGFIKKHAIINYKKNRIKPEGYFNE